jgi:ADP-ribosylglycohydrolase
VPQAIVAFLENGSFEDVIKGAISIGGDSDTIAAIAGSLAEAFAENHDCVSVDLKRRVWKKLDSGIKFAVRTMSEMVRQIRPELWSPWNDPAPNVQPNGEDL